MNVYNARPSSIERNCQPKRRRCGDAAFISRRRNALSDDSRTPSYDHRGETFERGEAMPLRPRRARILENDFAKRHVFD